MGCLAACRARVCRPLSAPAKTRHFAAAMRGTSILSAAAVSHSSRLRSHLASFLSPHSPPSSSSSSRCARCWSSSAASSSFPPRPSSQSSSPRHSPSAVPSPSSASLAWSSLPLSSAMLSALSAVGLQRGATAIQQAAIRSAAFLPPLPAAASHSSALLLATRTGSGKTLAALIPALERAMAAEREATTETARESGTEREDKDEQRERQQQQQQPAAGESRPSLHSMTASIVSSTVPKGSPLRLLSPSSLFGEAGRSASSSAVASSVLCRPLSVMIVPSRELVDQHYRTGKQLSHHLPVRVERLLAGRSRAQERRDLSSAAVGSRRRSASALSVPSQPHSGRHEVSLLVSTPGRLLAYIDGGLVSLSQLRTVVLDEADVLLAGATDGGFKDDCTRLIKLAKAAAANTSLASRVAFSSSSSSSSLLFVLLAASVPRSLRSFLPSMFPRLLDLSSHQLHTLPPSVRLSFIPVHAGNKLDRLIAVVRDIVTSTLQPPPSVLLFCNSLGSCRVVLAALTLHFQQQPLPQHIAARYAHSLVLAHHGDLPGQLRTSNLRAFRDGECAVLVVTDLLSRGLDLPQLTHVLQFDMSLNSTDFMHRVGRLARRPLNSSEQQPQYAIALIRKGDAVLAQAIEAQFYASNSVAELSSDKRHYQKM